MVGLWPWVIAIFFKIHLVVKSYERESGSDLITYLQYPSFTKNCYYEKHSLAFSTILLFVLNGTN